MAVFARVNPYDPRRGFLCKTYVFKGFKYEGSRGWYRISESLAEELKKCYQDPNAPDPKPIFQICTQAEAEALQRDEYERENPTRKIQEAIAGAQSVPDPKLATDVADEDGEEKPSEKSLSAKPTKSSGKAASENPFGS